LRNTVLCVHALNGSGRIDRTDVQDRVFFAGNPSSSERTHRYADFEALRNEPYLLNNAKIYCLDYEFALAKGESGALWRVLNNFETNKEKELYLSFWGNVFEDHVAWIFEIYASKKHNAVYPSPKYLNDPTREICDCIIICGITAILIETKLATCKATIRYSGKYEPMRKFLEDRLVKRLEAAFRSLDDKCRLYQILFKRNDPVIPHAEYENPLVRAAVEQRAAFLKSKSDRLCSIEIFWVVMVDGSYQKTGLLHALSQLPKDPRSSLRDLRALFSANRERSLLYEQTERDRLRLQQKVNSLSGQLNDLTTVGLPGAEETFRILRRLVNLRPTKIDDAPLCDARHLDWQVCDSELEAHRGYLRLDDDYLRVLTLKELPSETRPLLLQGLFDIPPNFHVVTEWHPVTNDRARKEIASRRRHYHNSKTSFVSNLQDRQNTGNQDNLVDDSKAAAVAELGNALTAMGISATSKAWKYISWTLVILRWTRMQTVLQ
jgi:hypothetical protein